MLSSTADPLQAKIAQFKQDLFDLERRLILLEDRLAHCPVPDQPTTALLLDVPAADFHLPADRLSSRVCPIHLKGQRPLEEVQV